MRHTGRRAAGHAVPLRAAGAAAGRPARLAAAESSDHDAGIRNDSFQGQADSDRVRRIRPAGGSAKGVFHLAFHGTEARALDSRAERPDRSEGGPRLEPHLRARFRQQRRRQQRGQPLRRTALRLLDRRRDRLAADVGLYGRRPEGRHARESLPAVFRREGRLDSRLRLDDSQQQTVERGPILSQRHFHRREPEADGLPHLRARRQQQ